VITSRYEFNEILAPRIQTGLFVEIGVWHGNYSETIRSWGLHSLLYLVDPWRQLEGYKDSINKTEPEEFDRLYKMVCDKFAADSTVKILRQTSDAAVDGFIDECFDWVYIDANHDYAHTSQDIKMWFPKVRPGGIMSGHDYSDCTFADGTEFGVKSAVTDFVKDRWPVHHLTEKQDNSWYFVKE